MKIFKSASFIPLALSSLLKSSSAFVPTNPSSFINRRYSNTLTTSTNTATLNMIRISGLEVREEGASPTAGDMTLYIKAGPDGTSPGDCPFAHYVRMVLHEKSLPYTVAPATEETKPDWLIDHYGGSMPALRHRKECYIESDVIAQYVDFFFLEPKLSPYKKTEMTAAKECTDGFFPAIAKYLKHTRDDEKEVELKANLEAALGKIETHLGRDDGSSRSGEYLAGDGESFTILDCGLAPKLYHLSVGLKAFKDNAIDMENQFPLVKKYMDSVFDRDSFKDAIYPEETVVWGWSNARGN